MLFMGSRHKPSTAGQAWLLQEKGDVLGASKCLHQQLLQLVQARGTPCSTCSKNTWFSPPLSNHAHTFCF